MEYHENIIGFTSIVFTSSMDIVSITHELSKDYIENLGNTSYLKIGFIMVKIVCMSAEFNCNGEFKKLLRQVSIHRRSTFFLIIVEFGCADFCCFAVRSWHHYFMCRNAFFKNSLHSVQICHSVTGVTIW